MTNTAAIRAQEEFDSPSKKVRTVAPGASDLPEGPCRALYIGTLGNVTLIAEGDVDEVTFVGVPAGSILPVRTRQVSASTTASNIVALY